MKLNERRRNETARQPRSLCLQFIKFHSNHSVFDWNWLNSVHTYRPSLRVFHSIHFMKWNEITRCAGRFPFVTLMVPFGPCPFRSFNWFTSISVHSLTSLSFIRHPFNHSLRSLISSGLLPFTRDSFNQLHFVNWWIEWLPAHVVSPAGSFAICCFIAVPFTPLTSFL